MHRNYNLVVLVSLVLALFSCKKENKPNMQEDNPFDKAALLRNVADSIVLPSYSVMVHLTDSLLMSVSEFNNAPSSASLNQLKGVFREAYTFYQGVSILGFGPAEDRLVRVNCNVFPTDTIKINNNIEAGVWNLDAATNTAAKGFPAIEFLLYGYNQSEASVLQKFSDGKRGHYLFQLCFELQKLFKNVYTDWTNGYHSSFVSQLSTDIGSPIGYLVNQLNFELDYLKNAKIATPLGLRSDGTPHPDNCEGFYAGSSVPYLLKTLEAIEKLYRGGQGIGFDDYLDHLGAANGNERLTTVINLQFTKCKQSLMAIPDPMSDHLVSDKATLEGAYKDLVKLLVYLKTDLPSALGVVITYQDGDGD